MSSTPMSLSCSPSASLLSRVAPTHSRPTKDVVKPSTMMSLRVRVHAACACACRVCTVHMQGVHCALCTVHCALCMRVPELDEDAEVIDHAVDHDDEHRYVFGLRHGLEQVQHGEAGGEGEDVLHRAVQLLAHLEAHIAAVDGEEIVSVDGERTQHKGQHDHDLAVRAQLRERTHAGV